jgi:hypothetical protein
VKLVSPNISLKELEKVDVFCNISKILDISCPIFLIHGKKDQIIPVTQSNEMAKYMKIVIEWHPRNGDHSNILTFYRTKFFQKLKYFLDYLNYFEVRESSSVPVKKEKPSKKEKREILINYNHFDGNNLDGCSPSKVEENNTYMQKFSNLKFASTKRDTNYIDDKIITNNYNSICSSNYVNKYPKSNFVNALIEYPSFDNFHQSYKNSQLDQNIDGRISTESNVICYNNSKESEDQYNKICYKHLGK